MTMLYAVTPVDVVAPGGLDSLRGKRVAVVHDERSTGPTSDRAAVLAFGETVQRIAERGPALPMRYGTTVADVAELRLLIAEHEEQWSARLSAVGDCCELIVHLEHLPCSNPAPGKAAESGRDYLQRRIEVVRKRDAVHDELLAMLRPWLRESRVLPGSRSDRMAVLVPRDAAADARSRLERWADDRADVEVAVTGPWPPFSFCEAPG